MKRTSEDLIGKHYSRLTVIKQMKSDNRYNRFYWCECECGNEKPIRGKDLISGNTRSCGCLRAETTATMITFKGKTQSLSAWARELKIELSTLHRRLYRSKWSIEKALTVPVRENKWKTLLSR